MGRRGWVEIKIETRQLLSVRLRGEVINDWCAQCQQQTEMIRLRSSLAGAALRLSGAHLTPDVLHVTKAADGSLLACLRPPAA